MNLFEETKKVSALNPNTELFFRVAKMQEELGELATACLEFHHYKNRKDKSAEYIAENIYEEIADIVLVAYDLIHIVEMSEEELQVRITEKMEKWKKGIENFKEKGFPINEESVLTQTSTTPNL